MFLSNQAKASYFEKKIDGSLEKIFAFSNEVKTMLSPKPKIIKYQRKEKSISVSNNRCLLNLMCFIVFGCVKK